VLKIHEAASPAGDLAAVFLRRAAGGALELVGDGGALPLPLPPGALGAVMRRFGAPLDPTEPLTVVDALELGGGNVLRHVRHRARYDVIARDYLVLEAPDGEPLCALATAVAGALAHLGRAALARGGSGPGA
jgi:hypothetical protein